MSHATEYAIVLTNILLTIVSLALTVVTAMDNNALAKLTAMAIRKPRRRTVKDTRRGKHEAAE